jgi:hypothetical protein
MIIHLVKDKGQFKLNQTFASAVPEFAALLDDNAFGINYLAYVIYANDLAEDNIYAGLPKKIREQVIAEDLNLDKSKLKDDKVKKAMAKYKLFCDENVAYKIKESYNKGMDKLSKYIDGADVHDDNAKEFSATLKSMPDILEGSHKLGKLGMKEEAKQGRARGGRITTIAEKVN